MSENFINNCQDNFAFLNFIYNKNVFKSEHAYVIDRTRLLAPLCAQSV